MHITWCADGSFEIEGPGSDDPGTLLSFMVTSPEYAKALELWRASGCPGNKWTREASDVVIAGGDDERAQEQHFGVCPTCGQAYDRRDFAQVAHHVLGRGPHEPLELND